MFKNRKKSHTRCQMRSKKENSHKIQMRYLKNHNFLNKIIKYRDKNSHLPATLREPTLANNCRHFLLLNYR